MFAFGSLTFDPVAGALLRADRPVPMSPRMAAVLTTLLTRHGTLVTYEDLANAAWGRQDVSQLEIDHYITLIRDAFGDGRAETHVVTVPGRGFRFVSALDRPPTLTTAEVVQAPPVAPEPPPAPSADTPRKRTRRTQTPKTSPHAEQPAGAPASAQAKTPHRARKTRSKPKPEGEPGHAPTELPPPEARQPAEPVPASSATVVPEPEALPSPEPTAPTPPPPPSQAPTSHPTRGAAATATEPVPATAPAPASAGLRPGWLGIGLLLIVGAAVLAWPYLTTQEEPAPVITEVSAPLRQILVVPFLTDPGSDAVLGTSIADGVTQALKPVLPGGVSQQIVPVPGETLAAVGRRLGADAVVGGMIEQSGANVRISMELVRVSDGERLSSLITEGDQTSIRELQRQISRHLARALRPDAPDATPESNEASPPQVPVAAYLSFQRAHAAWLVGSPGSNTASIPLFRLAIEQNPSSARAHAELAIAYGLLDARTDPLVSQPHAVAAAERAVALAPDSALAQAALGLVRARFQWRWSDAEAAFDAAFSTMPQDPLPFRLRAWYRTVMGQPDEALVDLRQAQRLQPDSPAIRTALIEALVTIGQVTAARTELDTLATERPNWPQLEHLESRVATAEGREADGLASWWRALLLDGVPQGRVDALRAEYRANGKASMEARWATQLAREVEEGPAPPRSYRLATDLALAHAALGHKDDTLSWLSVAIDLHEDAPLLMLSPAFDLVRTEPRFAELLRRTDLPARQ